MGQDAVFAIPLFLEFPSLRIFGVVKHTAVFPVNCEPGGCVVNGKVRLAGSTSTKSKFLFVRVVDSETVQLIRDDDFRLGHHEFTASRAMNVLAVVPAFVYDDWFGLRKKIRKSLGRF